MATAFGHIERADALKGTLDVRALETGRFSLEAMTNRETRIRFNLSLYSLDSLCANPNLCEPHYDAARR